MLLNSFEAILVLLDFNSHPTTEAWSYVYLFTCKGMVPRPPITSLQSAGYVGPICPFKTSAVSLTAREILSLLKSVLKLPLTSIKRGFASWLRENQKNVGRAY